MACSCKPVPKINKLVDLTNGDPFEAGGKIPVLKF